MLPGPAGCLAAGRGGGSCDLVVRQCEFLPGPVELAGQQTEVSAAHSGGFGSGDRAAAVSDPAPDVSLSDSRGLAQGS
jgi:hypothetical protein